MTGPTSDLQETDPTQLGGYRLHGRLQTSSLGVVYLGRDSTGAEVEVAVLNAGAGIDPGARQRFVDTVEEGADVLSARTRGRAPLWVAVERREEGPGAGDYLRRAGQGGPVVDSGPVVMPHWSGESVGAVRWPFWGGGRGSGAGAGPGNWWLVLALAVLLLVLLLSITLLFWWMLQFPPPEEMGGADAESSPSPGEGQSQEPETPSHSPTPGEGEGWGDRPEDNL
ncbi:hypothetical protein [Nocardiopsis kunsanensis]|uniref:Serine/threonine protein kinase n=1 Tax=Nocardiopsis kunsanensis TaxID=141693 RepID=A0A919CIK8_9ACTN|nr:hypothetical protein [Nocardiopsis kunsanensis]GHD29083.1 hypothetical protein GCM10007147_29550 [Nocardiopsis kunsanensis]